MLYPSSGGGWKPKGRLPTPWGTVALAESIATSAVSCIVVVLVAAMFAKDSTAELILSSKALMALAVSECFLSCFLSRFPLHHVGT